MERPTTGRRDPSDTKAERFAQAISRLTGSSAAFGIALAMVIAWGLSGPIFGYSDTWQLVMNTVSSIATLLMVFLIQRAQNKDALAMHVKLNEIIKAIEGASNHIVNAEGLSETTLSRLQKSYQRIAENAQGHGEPPLASERPAVTVIPRRSG